MSYKLSFYTSHHQFYITDKDSPQETDAYDFWTEEATQNRLALGDGLLGVGLECYGPFKGELLILNKKENHLELVKYDHIVEGGLEIKSEILQILNCPNLNVELEVQIPAGKYRARIYSSNLASVGDNDSGDDYYKIEIWPDTKMERTVLKQYSNPKN
jgi:hypothetical protein